MKHSSLSERRRFTAVERVKAAFRLLSERKLQDHQSN